MESSRRWSSSSVSYLVSQQCILLAFSACYVARQSLIDDYSKDKGIFIFLLSTKAGEFGKSFCSQGVGCQPIFDQIRWIRTGKLLIVCVGGGIFYCSDMVSVDFLKVFGQQ